MNINDTKAYSVSSTNHEYGVVVFAKTRNEAKKIAKNLSEWFEECEYIDLRSSREKWADGLREHDEILDFCSNSDLFHKNNWVCYNSGDCDEYGCNFKKDENDF